MTLPSDQTARSLPTTEFSFDHDDRRGAHARILLRIPANAVKCHLIMLGSRGHVVVASTHEGRCQVLYCLSSKRPPRSTHRRWTQKTTTKISRGIYACARPPMHTACCGNVRRASNARQVSITVAQKRIRLARTSTLKGLAIASFAPAAAHKRQCVWLLSADIAVHK